MEQKTILKKIKIYNWLFSIAFMHEIYFNQLVIKLDLICNADDQKTRDLQTQKKSVFKKVA